MMKFSDWLQSKFLEWEKKSGHRQSYANFARYLGVKQPSLVHWMNDDNPPSIKYIQLLASKLGPEVYDYFEIPRPPQMIREIEEVYEFIPPTDQTEFDQDFEKWLEDWLTSHGFKRIK